AGCLTAVGGGAQVPCGHGGGHRPCGLRQRVAGSTLAPEACGEPGEDGQDPRGGGRPHQGPHPYGSPVRHCRTRCSERASARHRGAGPSHHGAAARQCGAPARGLYPGSGAPGGFVHRLQRSRRNLHARGKPPGTVDECRRQPPGARAGVEPGNGSTRQAVRSPQSRSSPSSRRLLARAANAISGTNVYVVGGRFLPIPSPGLVEPRPMLVMKFGGTSVGDPARIVNLCDIVSARDPRDVVVVVSAASRVTDMLLTAARNAAAGHADASPVATRVHGLLTAFGLPTSLVAAELDGLSHALSAIARAGSATAETLDTV